MSPTVLVSYFAVLWMCICSTVAHAELNEALWSIVRQAFFAARPIADNTQLIEIEGPRGAENAAQVPITLSISPAQIPADAITKVTLLVDANPIPLIATYHLPRLNERMHISTRIRMEADSHVRAIGETADGRLFMTTIVIHAGGGCAGPVNGDDATIRAAAGQIKLNNEPPTRVGATHRIVFMIRHPMYTGLQRDVASGQNKPAFYIRQASFSHNSKAVLRVDFGVGTAENPYLRFPFTPDGPGILRVEAEDNEGQHFSHDLEIPG